MWVGISVRCTVCNRAKKPHGRSAPFGSFYCEDDCAGYLLEPKPGCLWPGETGQDFGYAHCYNATKALEIPS